MLQKLSKLFRCKCLDFENEKKEKAGKESIHVTVISPQIQNVKATVCMDPRGSRAAPRGSTGPVFSTFQSPPSANKPTPQPYPSPNPSLSSHLSSSTSRLVPLYRGEDSFHCQDTNTKDSFSKGPQYHQDPYHQKDPRQRDPYQNKDSYHYRDSHHQKDPYHHKDPYHLKDPYRQVPYCPSSAYSSSSLDEPAPVWSAYQPYKDVAWSPSQTHCYYDDDDEEEEEEEKEKGKKNKGRRKKKKDRGQNKLHPSTETTNRCSNEKQGNVKQKNVKIENVKQPNVNQRYVKQRNVKQASDTQRTEMNSSPKNGGRNSLNSNSTNGYQPHPPHFYHQTNHYRQSYHYHQTHHYHLPEKNMKSFESRSSLTELNVQELQKNYANSLPNTNCYNNSEIVPISFNRTLVKPVKPNFVDMGLECSEGDNGTVQVYNGKVQDKDLQGSKKMQHNGKVQENGKIETYEEMLDNRCNNGKVLDYGKNLNRSSEETTGENSLPSFNTSNNTSLSSSRDTSFSNSLETKSKSKSSSYDSHEHSESRNGSMTQFLDEPDHGDCTPVVCRPEILVPFSPQSESEYSEFGYTESGDSEMSYQARKSLIDGAKTYDSLSLMLDWEMDAASILSADFRRLSFGMKSPTTEQELDQLDGSYGLDQVQWSSTDTLVDDTPGVNYAEVFRAEDKEDEELNLQNFMSLHDLTQVVIPRQNLRTGKLLLKGHNFSVYSGCLKSESASYPAYVKPVCTQVFAEVNSGQDQVHMLQNVQSLRALRHRNILEVLGVCIEGSTGSGTEVLMVTSRTHSAATLHRLLHWCRDNNPQLLTPQSIVTFSMEILQGLLYLQDQGIIHNNLTTSTIMLDSNCTIKLSGIEPHTISMRTPAYRWIAIESHRNRATHKSTVWSFGVVLWAMTAYGATPYNHLKKHQVFQYLCKGKRLQRPTSCPKSLFVVAHECWHSRPYARPSFQSLLRLLTEYKQRLPSSPPPHKLFPDREDFWTIVQEHMEDR